MAKDTPNKEKPELDPIRPGQISYIGHRGMGPNNKPRHEMPHSKDFTRNWDQKDDSKGEYSFVYPTDLAPGALSALPVAAGRYAYYKEDGQWSVRILTPDRSHLPGYESPLSGYKDEPAGGDKYHYPENSLAAFREAIKRGADGIEFDIYLSRDKVPMVTHDDTLNTIVDPKWGNKLAKKPLEGNNGDITKEFCQATVNHLYLAQKDFDKEKDLNKLKKWKSDRKTHESLLAEKKAELAAAADAITTYKSDNKNLLKEPSKKYEKIAIELAKLAKPTKPIDPKKHTQEEIEQLQKSQHLQKLENLQKIESLQGEKRNLLDSSKVLAQLKQLEQTEQELKKSITSIEATIKQRDKDILKEDTFDGKDNRDTLLKAAFDKSEELYKPILTSLKDKNIGSFWNFSDKEIEAYMLASPNKDRVKAGELFIGRASNKTSEELQEFVIGYGKDGEKQTIPTLEGIFKFAHEENERRDMATPKKPHLILNIELKGENTAEETALLINRMLDGKLKDGKLNINARDLLVLSFNHEELDKFKQNLTENHRSIRTIHALRTDELYQKSDIGDKYNILAGKDVDDGLLKTVAGYLAPRGNLPSHDGIDTGGWEYTSKLVESLNASTLSKKPDGQGYSTDRPLLCLSITNWRITHSEGEQAALFENIAALEMQGHPIIVKTDEVDVLREQIERARANLQNTHAGKTTVVCQHSFTQVPNQEVSADKAQSSASSSKPNAVKDQPSKGALQTINGKKPNRDSYIEDPEMAKFAKDIAEIRAQLTKYHHGKPDYLKTDRPVSREVKGNFTKNLAKEAAKGSDQQLGNSH